MQRNMIEALMGVRVSREGFNKGAVKVARGVAGLALASTIGCERPREDTSPSPASVVPPGKELLDKTSQELGEKARELAGMGSPIPAQLKAKEITPRPTIAAPNTQVAEKPKTPTQAPAKPTAEAKKPVEGLRTVEDQVKAAGLDALLSLLNSSQEYHNIGYWPPNGETLVSRITKPVSSFPKTEIISDKPIPPDSDLLKVEWAYEAIGIQKVFGEGEIKNIKVEIESASQVTDADKANGIQWKGIVSLSTIHRYRLLFATGSYAKKDYVPQHTIPFSEWRDGGINFSFVLRDGRWENQNKGIQYPIRWNIPDDWCGNRQEPNCKLVDVK